MPRNPVKRPTDGRKSRKAGPRPGRDQGDVERARIALTLSEGSAAEAARKTGIPRSTISGWIAEGKFNPDEWDELRKERARGAIELAYDGMRVLLKELAEVPHKKVATKEGDVVDLGVDAIAASNAVRAQLEVVKAFGGKDLNVQKPTGVTVVVRGYDPSRDARPAAQPPAGGVRVPAQAPAVRTN